MDLAARLAEHMVDESLSDREIEVLKKEMVADHRNREIGLRLFYFRRNSEGPYQAVHGKTGR